MKSSLNISNSYASIDVFLSLIIFPLAGTFILMLTEADVD
jgi:hypothetical protein